jgi:hypothetical protein
MTARRWRAWLLTAGLLVAGACVLAAVDTIRPLGEAQRQDMSRKEWSLTSRDGQRRDMTRIFGDESWYRARGEPERTWEGVLVPRDVTVGPDTRTALTHALESGSERMPIYAPGLHERLAPLVNRRVRIIGKLVDLSSEGFTEELWIGWIGALPNQAPDDSLP